MRSLLSRDSRVRLACENDGDVQVVIDAIYDAKLGDDVVYAYMAETYPLDRDAEVWRRLSGTRNGVYTALFLNTLSRWDNWIAGIARRLPGRRLSPAQRLFIAWIRGTLPAEFAAQAPELKQAAELRPITSETLAQELVN
ncbi:hypothetical protein HZA87_05500 [Candidatus Uhrbacteria bacterium]|nr:hypothetical protein [Candidatus Uhrbacteria bacterium]